MEFNIDKEWRSYLKTAGFEESKMSEIQRKEMKRAFVGGLGATGAIITEAFRTMEPPELFALLNQGHVAIANFWAGEAEKESGKLN